jgi:hypothetical protein
VWSRQPFKGRPSVGMEMEASAQNVALLTDHLGSKM